MHDCDDSDDSLFYYRPTPVKRKELPLGARPVMECEPPTHSYHYSNSRSQNSLICQTDNWDGFYFPDRQEMHSAYSDRLQGWDAARYRRLCEFIGTGEQGWPRLLVTMTYDRMREAAQIAFDLPKLPLQVRFVHHYNVATGYSCPTIEAISEKAISEKPSRENCRI
jgi:hypothetical protein